MELERNLTFSSLILANCPLFSLNSYTNSELVHIGAPSNAYQQFIPICATKHRNDKITSWYDLLIYNFPFNCAWYITSALSTLCSFVSKGTKTKVQISSVLSTRTSSEFVYEFSENKGQFARIRDENVKFHSVLHGLSWRYRVGGSLWLYLK